MRAAFAIDQLNVHPNLVTDPPHAAFEDVIHPKLVTDLFCVYLFALVGERGISGDHETAGKTREIGSRVDGTAALPASRVLVMGAELGAAGVGGARRLGMLPRTSPATCAAKPRELDAACTMVETGGSDAITVASIA